MHVAEGDRTQARRAGSARDNADIAVAGEQLRAPRWHLAFHDERHELLGDAAMSAMKDPDDDLLPHVTPFGKGDRPTLDSRFERDGFLRHVDAEQRISRFNPRGFD